MQRLPLIWKIALVVILVGIVTAIHSTVKAYRDRVAVLQHDLAERIATTRTQSEIRRELTAYRPTIGGLTRYTITSPEEMLALVESIESQGRLENVLVTIPTIEEIVPTITQIDTQDPITDARVAIVSNGYPEQLLAFLHRVEHLPYALVLEEWNLKTNTRTEYRDEGGQALKLSELTLTIRIPIHNYTINETSE